MTTTWTHAVTVVVASVPRLHGVVMKRGGLSEYLRPMPSLRSSDDLRLRRTVLLSLCASLALLSCGKAPRTFDVQKPVTQEPISVRTQGFPNTQAAAARGIRQRQYEQIVFAVVLGHAKEQPVASLPEPSSVTPPPQESWVPAKATTSIWDCIAEAETGSDYSMHGSTYSTAFGMVNDIVEDYGTPEEQAAVFSGTASKETQIRIASAFVAENGFGGWGELTKSKCGL